MKTLNRWITYLLVFAMLLSMTACGKKAPQAATTDAQQLPAQQTEQSAAQIPTEATTATEPAATEPVVAEPAVDDLGNVTLAVDTTDRDSLEQIVELLGSNKNPNKLSDKELGDLAEDLLENLENEKNTDDIVDLENNQTPNTGVEFDESAYDDEGAMTKPFDQVYPELVEQGEVAYDDETLLVKMKNSRKGKISDGMKKAGVVTLEAVVPMEEATWYEAYLKEGTDAADAVEALRKLKEVILVEYNYQVKTAAIDDYQALPTNLKLQNNPRLNEQWYMNHFGIPGGYEKKTKPGGDSSVVVAVIDSGVDYDHEDLADNIWFNKNEIPDNGIDDDNNGYIDDYYGVDVVSGTGNGDDTGGHGTHVAGIIAAQNNNLGMVGIAYNVKIMPIKAGSAYLLDSDIAKAVLYAYENGAEVINMSFGGMSSSIAVQDALAVAYTRCVLVASAGNSGMHNEGEYALPNYPAALTYVLGVMSVDQYGKESAFTNYDSVAFSGVEYEVYAPGEGILSTLPNNQYGILSGTSMAAPVVSAYAAILRSEFSDRDTYPTRFIYGQLSSTSGYTASCFNPSLHGIHNIPQVADLQAALTKLPQPELGVQDFALFDTKDIGQDTSGKNNGDGVIDAGETIALGLTLRNRWGQSKDTVVTIDTISDISGMADPYIEILNNEVYYGSIGTYATGDCGKIYTDEIFTAWENPFYIKIADNCPNDYFVTFNVTIACGNEMNSEDTNTYLFRDSFTLMVRSGKILPSVIDKDMTLTKDNLYIIPNATVIEKGVTVTVEPGTNIQFWSADRNDPYADRYMAALNVKGTLLIEGTKEEPVNIYPADSMDQYVVEFKNGGGYISMRHANITNLHQAHVAYAEYCNFTYNYTTHLLQRSVEMSGEIKNWSVWGSTVATFQSAKYCTFYQIGSQDRAMDVAGSLDTCIFVDCAFDYSRATTRNCVFLGNYVDNSQNEWQRDTNSVLQVSLPGMSMGELADPSAVFYRPETGTTYAISSMHSGTVTELLATLGGDFAIIEDEAELNWICQALTSNNANTLLRIVYDHNAKTFTWHDGSAIGTFLNSQELLNSARADYLFGLNQVTKTLTNGNNGEFYGRYLYEIPGEILPTEITFTAFETVLDPQTTYQIVPLSQPAQLGVDMFIYESSDESVLTVSETGLVTPVALGKADVTVYSKDKAVWNHISFDVKDYVALEGITFPAAQAAVAVGETEAYGVSLTPDNTTRRNVTYTSSDESIATVDFGGNITGVSAGNATITASCEGISVQLPVTVFRKTVKLTLDQNFRVETMGESETVALPTATFSENTDVELEWTSSDTEVAQITDNGIVLLKSGTTAIIATDKNSGMQASQQLYVLEGARSPIVDMQYNAGSYYYVLCENGNLYGWCNSMQDPRLVAENVKAFSTDSSELCMIKNDNTLIKGYWSDGNWSPNLTNDFFKDLNPVGVTYFNNKYYVWTDSGALYTWGQNDSGELGLGFVGWQETPMMVNLDTKIVQVKADYSMAVLLSDSGDLYVTGGDEYQTHEPLRIAQRVSNLVKITTENAFLYSSGDTWYAISAFSAAPNMVAQASLKPSDYDLICRGNSGWCIGAINNRIYYQDYVESEMGGSWTTVELPGTYENITAVYCDASGNYWFTTADGLLYGFGANSNGGLAGVASGSTNEAVMIPAGLPSNETMTFTGSNLSDENILTEDVLTLSFSKKLANNSGVQLLENGTAITATVKHENNTITVSRATGFKTGVTYKLKISASNLAGMASAALAENLELTFTYGTPDIIVHETQTDLSIRKYWDVISMREYLQQMQEQMQINGQFYNNAILNRISTDTDVGHWLRPTPYEAGSGTPIALGGNYWGTVNESAIDLQIFDYADNIDFGRIVYKPYLTEAPSNTFPFITSVKVLDKTGKEATKVGAEEVTIRVTFNRDMDTSIPLKVCFGTAYPYADYEVTEGKYVNARTWEGKYFISTVIGNGYQYFSIGDGMSATDELKLFTDRMRFAFQLDTTEAQALLMQGYATDTGIQLSWTQDDFDTLMGYNIYRATEEDGLYTKVNTTVIPGNTTTFFDDTVEPGVRYYYNFTVVQTDMAESAPSGKISIMSKDTMAPNIYHSPVYTAFTNENLLISATVTDNLNISYTKVYYRTTGSSTWKTAQMNHLNDKYSAIIPASEISMDGLEYYLEAYDGISFTYKGSAEKPFKVTVKQAINKNALGDVNGDNKISNLDALMLLQAINDQLNLSTEQFIRADLNGNGILEAKEALRILHYVSGTVGSLTM